LFYVPQWGGSAKVKSIGMVMGDGGATDALLANFAAFAASPRGMKICLAVASVPYRVPYRAKAGPNANELQSRVARLLQKLLSRA
jgi:hypothetical protein